MDDWKANPFSVSLAQGGALWGGCLEGEGAHTGPDLRDGGYVPGSSWLVPSPSPSQKLQGNCFLAAFPSPLWFIAARRLCVWRWHKSHQKERRKFAFIPFLAYWMQLSSSLLKSWAGLGQEGQALALVLSMAKAGLAALPEEAPMTSNSHIQQLYLHWLKSTAIFKKQRMNKENIGNYCLWDYIFTGSPSVFSLAKNKLATRQTKNCKRGRRKNSGHNMLISSKSWRLSAHLCFCTGWWLQIAHWSNGGSKELITVPRPNLTSSHRQHLLRSHWGRKDWTRDSGDCEGEKN